MNLCNLLNNVKYYYKQLQMQEQSSTCELDYNSFKAITNSYIVGILSYSMSPLRKKIAINTVYGFVLVPNYTTFTRFQKKESPFYRSSKYQQESLKIGVSISALLDSRNQIAIVPQQGSKYFNDKHVYIFDYQLKTILYKNDFFQPIKQLAFNKTDLIVSSKKRIIIYGYLDDQHAKNQKYYIDKYNSVEENDSIRYFQTHCEAAKSEPCRCGQFNMSLSQPFKLAYLKIGTVNKAKHKSIMVYDSKIDKEYQFEVLVDQQPFVFCISSDGKYLAYSKNYGRQGRIYSLQGNSLKCTLYLGREISPIVNHGFFFTKQKLWYSTVRQKQNGSATIHFFNIQKGNSIEPLLSQYKRYISLFQKTFQDYGIASKLIGPDYYVKNDIYYSFSLCGVIHDVIDFKRTGHHDKKKVDNSIQWSEAAHNEKKRKALLVLTNTGKHKSQSLEKATGFWFSEVSHFYIPFAQLGWQIDIVSPSGGICPIDPESLLQKYTDSDDIELLNNHRFKNKLQTSLKPSDIKPGNYDLIYFAGGHGAIYDFYQPGKIHEIAVSIFEKGGVIAAISHGVAVTVNLKLTNQEYLIKNKKITAFLNEQQQKMQLAKHLPYSLQNQLIKRECKFQRGTPWSEHIVVDQRLMTGQNHYSGHSLVKKILKHEWK